MNKLADLIEKNIDELAELETLDNGKPISESRNADLPLVIDCFRYYAGWADKIHGQTIPIRGNYFCYTKREPVGVAGQIIPWNFPMLMVAWKWGPALAAGCTVVMKPAEQTPLSALRLGELALEAGFPAGVINIVPGFGETAGDALVKHPGVDKIAFTGSTDDRPASSCGTPPTRSSGSPSSWAARARTSSSPTPTSTRPSNGAMLGLYLNQGQCCCAGSRLFVEDKVYDAIVERLAAEGETRKLGDPFDPATEQGPQVDKTQFDKILGYIETGKEQGARCVTGGERFGDKGFFIKPTIFADVKDDMAIATRGDLRPGPAGAQVQGHRGGRRAGQHDRLRPGRRRLDPRHRQGPRHRRPRPRRHRLDQLLRRLRRRRPLRRLQGQRHRPRARREGPRQLHRAQDGDGRAGLISKMHVARPCDGSPAPITFVAAGRR